jgi:hypothetical protein
MSTRAIPADCEICGLAPPVSGVGFPSWPGALPGLPGYLRGTCLWVCATRACDLAAQARALRAAKAAGITLAKIWRHWPVSDRPSPAKGKALQ